jgi:predicted SnoaL-like aldol condensation-catalyzing enzyme
MKNTKIKIPVITDGLSDMLNDMISDGYSTEEALKQIVVSEYITNQLIVQKGRDAVVKEIGEETKDGYSVKYFVPLLENME